MSTHASPLAQDDLDAVAAELASWITRATTERGRHDRLRRYYRSALNRHALGELLIEAVPGLPDERAARAAQAWEPLVTRVERGWEQRMLLFAAVMVHLQRAEFRVDAADLPPMMPPDDADVDLDDFEQGPA